MTRFKANILLLLTAAIWGTSFVAQKFGLMHMGPAAFSAARFALGTLAVAPFALIGWRQRGIDAHRLTLADWGGMVITGMCLCLGAVTQQTGIASTSVTNAGFLTALYVPFVPLLAFVFLRRLPHPVVWPAAAASLFGAWALSGGGKLALSAGDAWVVLSAVFWAIHVLLVGHMVRRMGGATLLSLVQFAVAAVFALALAEIAEDHPWAGLADAWIALTYVGILSVGVGFTLQGAAQRFTPPADAAIILSAEVLFAAIGGALVFGERLNTIKLVGCLAIICAMLVVQIVPVLGRRRR